jgi:hypothetical protein
MEDTLELVEIDTADTFEELCEKEIGYILSYNSHYIDGYGYNGTIGGEGTNGYSFTEEQRKNVSKSQLRRFENPEAREQSSEAAKKRFENPEEREKHHIRMNKRFEDNPELRGILSELKKKYFENPETREQCSESQKKRFENPDERKQCSESQKKRFENPEARKQSHEAAKNYWDDNENAIQNARENAIQHAKNNPEAGKKRGEIIKKRYKDNPEMGKKCSEAQKKRFENPEARRKLSDGKGKNKPFDVFTKDGTFIKTFTYVFEANEYLQKEHNITSTIKIGAVLNGTRKSSAGFVFKYK